jgi:hypothetical protein
MRAMSELATANRRLLFALAVAVGLGLGLALVGFCGAEYTRSGFSGVKFIDTH